MGPGLRRAAKVPMSLGIKRIELGIEFEHRVWINFVNPIVNHSPAALANRTIIIFTEGIKLCSTFIRYFQ